MIPILFDSNEVSFASNGIGRLTDCTSCLVTEERNGIYEVEFTYPISGALFDEITEGRYIYVTHDDSQDPQPFEIYYRSAPIEGVVTFRAWHISYLLNNVIVGPFSASSCTDALSKLTSEAITANPFTFWTDKAVTAPYTLSVPRSVRSVLGGTENSLLDVYGKGEYEFDKWTVRLYVNRGANRGVSIRYGKNLMSLEQERDASEMFTGVIPYWISMVDENDIVSLDHAVYKTGYSSGRVVALDLSSEIEDEPTPAQLEAAAQAYVDSIDSFEIKENIKVDFVALWQTEEYKAVANLQRVYLCDTVNIFYEKLGINATAKCIKVVYDALNERYASMELGAPQTTLAQQIMSETANTLLRNVPSKSAMQTAIEQATELIGGGFGGYIKFNYLSDGTPSEMLVMDAPDEAEAVHIIRLNQNGLGFSDDGGTTYRNAWTIDGVLNADFINAGTLSSIAIDNGSGTFSVDSAGNMFASSGLIAGWNINGQALYKDAQGTDGYVYRVCFQPPTRTAGYALNERRLYFTGVTEEYAANALTINGLTASYSSANQSLTLGGASTWVLSIQKSTTVGTVGDPTLKFNGVFVLYSDGSLKVGKTRINANGTITASALNSSDVNITGGSLSLGSNFSVNSSGELTAKSGVLGGWTLKDPAIYKDVKGTDGYVYRTYFQPPLASGAQTWVLSVQKSQTQGNVGDNLVFDGVMVLYSDGSAKFGDTRIYASGQTTIGARGISDTDGRLTINATDGGWQFFTNYGYYLQNSSSDVLARIGTDQAKTQASLAVYARGSSSYNEISVSPAVRGMVIYADVPNGSSLVYPSASYTETGVRIANSSNNYSWVTLEKDGLRFWDGNGTLVRAFSPTAHTLTQSYNASTHTLTITS